MSVPTFTLGPVTVYFGEKSGKYPDGNQVVVRGRDATAAFDTPLVANRLGPVLDAVDLVILGHVHEDHMAGLHRMPAVRVFAPKLDLAAAQSWDGLARHYGYRRQVLAEMRAKIERDFHYVPRPDAIGYPDGHVWNLGGVQVRAVHMPGHTAGHCVLLVEPEGVAFIGDIDLTGFGPYYGDGCSSLAAFRQTVDRIADLPARTWVTSHHKGVITERARFLELLNAFREKFDLRAQSILGALAAQPRSLDALVSHRFLYPPGYQDVYIEDAERKTILEHLDELVAAGRVALSEGFYRPVSG
ncbi:MAG: MBL fold metallo-hydrolase [Betaproteobacteria bacterium]|nr:MBL fold metallo-hydrolase [Betaproteobacteria bacterium]